MKIKSHKIRLQYNESREPEIIITTSGNIQSEFEELKAIVAQGKELIAEIKQYRHKRSLDANAYCWQMCQKIGYTVN